MYEFQNKDITDDLYIDGYVLGYLLQSPGADNGEVITPLPYTIHKGEADGDNALLWTETYTYDYMPGSVAFMCNTAILSSNSPEIWYFV